MRPSSISFSSVIRAISRRMPSKDERTTALGVSSTMKSTPVRCSSVRMFRPSRPMIRPFMSSDGSSTSVTADSAAALAATRSNASATSFLARGLLLELAHAPGQGVAHLLLRLAEQPLPRLPDRHPRDPLQLLPLVLPQGLQGLLQLLEVDLPVGDPLLAPRQLLQPPVDLLLLREHALLDLDGRVPLRTQLLLQLGAQLHRPLARLDLRLAPRRLRVPARLLEQQRARAARRLEPRAAE